MFTDPNEKIYTYFTDDEEAVDGEAADSDHATVDGDDDALKANRNSSVVEVH